MGSRFQRRVSQARFFSGTFSRCPNHGFNGDCHQKVPQPLEQSFTLSPLVSVQRDIIRSLKMVEDKLFTAVHPFNRANLFYEVRRSIIPFLLARPQACWSGAVQVGARVALSDARYPGIHPVLASAT